MVEKSECYRTKFGSIHKTEEQAREAEKKEERDDFAARYCIKAAVNVWGYPYETAQYVYDNREIFTKLLTEYDFIEPLKNGDGGED